MEGGRSSSYIGKIGCKLLALSCLGGGLGYLVYSVHSVEGACGCFQELGRVARYCRFYERVSGRFLG